MSFFPAFNTEKPSCLAIDFYGKSKILISQRIKGRFLYLEKRVFAYNFELRAILLRLVLVLYCALSSCVFT